MLWLELFDGGSGGCGGGALNLMCSGGEIELYNPLLCSSSSK